MVGGGVLLGGFVVSTVEGPIRAPLVLGLVVVGGLFQYAFRGRVVGIVEE